MTAQEKIFKLLKPLSASNLTSIDEIEHRDDIFSIANTLLPEKTLQYDPECIDEINNYEAIFYEYASVTKSEWCPSEVEVSGSVEGLVKIAFSVAGKKQTWKFDQQGDYVSEGFLTKLSSYSARSLPGTFVHLSGYELISAVYLPKDIARKFKNISGKVLTIDIACKAIKENNKSLTSQPWFDNALNMTKGLGNERDRDGDTIFTSVLKGGDRDYIEYISDRNVNLIALGAGGEHPYQIALDNGIKDVADMIKGFFTRQAASWDNVKQEIAADPDEYNQEFEKFISKLSKTDSIARLHPAANTIIGSLVLGLTPCFLEGDKTLRVGCEDEKLHITLSIPGRNHQYVDTICEHQGAVEYVDKLLAS